MKLTALSSSVKHVEETHVIEFYTVAASHCLHGADFPYNTSGSRHAQCFPLAEAAKQFARVLLVRQEADFELGYGSIEASVRRIMLK